MAGPNPNVRRSIVHCRGEIIALGSRMLSRPSQRLHRLRLRVIAWQFCIFICALRHSRRVTRACRALPSAYAKRIRDSCPLRLFENPLSYANVHAALCSISLLYRTVHPDGRSFKSLVKRAISSRRGILYCDSFRRGRSD